MKTYQDLLNTAKQVDLVELQGGVYLESAEHLISQQKGWEDEDESKNFDFTSAPFWITTDDGKTPTAIHDAEDLKGEESSLGSNWLEA